MLKRNQVALGVRVKLNSNYTITSLSKKYLACEPVIYISDSQIYNDVNGDYVYVRGGSHVNSDCVYLKEIDLEFPVTESPIYSDDTIDYCQDLSRFRNEYDPISKNTNHHLYNSLAIIRSGGLLKSYGINPDITQTI